MAMVALRGGKSTVLYSRCDWPRVQNCTSQPQRDSAPHANDVNSPIIHNEKVICFEFFEVFNKFKIFEVKRKPKIIKINKIYEMYIIYL